MELIMAVKKIISDEIVLARTLDKVNREIGMAASASKRRSRLRVEKAGVENKLRQRRKLMPDR